MRVDFYGTEYYRQLMRVFMNKWFARWARKEKMTDEILTQAAKEVVTGQVEADLGGGLFKKRIARAGQGKRGGYRTLIGYCGKIQIG